MPGDVRLPPVIGQQAVGQMLAHCCAGSTQGRCVDIDRPHGVVGSPLAPFDEIALDTGERHFGMGGKGFLHGWRGGGER